MGTLSSLFRLNKGEAGEVLAVLTHIDRSRATVRVELERSLIRFNTRLSVKRTAVVVAKPPAIGSELQAGAFVRIKPPDDPRREVRLEVATPHFNLTNNQPVFLCKVPTAFAQPSQRHADRFDTRRFNNLRLELPGHEDLRILDISEHGCRILTPYAHPHERMPVTDPIGDAVLHLGKNARVQLAKVVPRTYDGKAVGCSITVDPGGGNRKLLQHLLRSLESVQRESLRAEAL